MNRTGPSKIPVTFFQRRPRAVGNYSVEFIFEDVRNRLKNLIDSKIVYSRYESNGLFKRIYNCMEAALKQKGVNHVTGDINYLGAFLNKKRTIHTILDCVFMTSTSGMKRNILKLFWLTIPVKRSRFITAISQATKEEIVKYSGCDPAKIIVIHVAISEKFLPRQRAFNLQKPVILQIGTAPNKNIPKLIEAIKNIPCELHIVGRLVPEYEELMKKENIEYRYDSGLSDEQMLRKYEEADIISLVSTYEGFGMPILESQAVGRPVITSNILSMPEVAGNAACLVDPNNVEAIRNGFQRIINDDAYREELVRKGFENVKRFNAQKIAMEYFDLYQKVYSN